MNLPSEISRVVTEYILIVPPGSVCIAAMSERMALRADYRSVQQVQSEQQDNQMQSNNLQYFP